jgi:glutamate 5-kinase
MTIVIKVGTNILTTESGKLNTTRLQHLADQISELKSTFGKSIVLVSSGSITCGTEKLIALKGSIPEKQAAAAVGQFLLMKEYDTAFSKHGVQVAQILLTQDGLSDKKRRSHTLDTLQTLLLHGVVPIVNENDTVSTEEIQFGDNDALSSQVALLLDASEYIILTDTEGLYDKNPKLFSDAKLISHVDRIDPSIMAMADSKTDGRSKGGMLSKLRAAKCTTDYGIPTIIAPGHQHNVLLSHFCKKNIGTHFQARSKK